MKFLGLAVVCVTALLAMASPAAARPDFRCNGVFKGKTYDEVMSARRRMHLVDSTVRGNVRALRNPYLQTVATAVRGDIEGTESQTIFIDTGSKVSGSVESVGARQFFVFNSTSARTSSPSERGKPSRSAAIPSAGGTSRCAGAVRHPGRCSRIPAPTS